MFTYKVRTYTALLWVKSQQVNQNINSKLTSCTYRYKFKL